MPSVAQVNAIVKQNGDREMTLEWGQRESWGAMSPMAKERKVAVYVRHNKTLVLRGGMATGEGTVITNLFVGQRPKKGEGVGNLTVADAVLDVAGVMEVMKQGENAKARGNVTLEGKAVLRLDGWLEGLPYNGCAEEAGTLSVGTNREGMRGGEGSLVLRDEAGVFVKRLVVGSETEAQGKGLVSLEGARVRVEGKGGLEVRTTGMVEFVMGEKGVGGMGFGEGGVVLGKGARVLVDGEKYAGGAGRFVLVGTKAVTGAEGASLEAKGFVGKYEARVGVEKEGVVLTVEEK